MLSRISHLSLGESCIMDLVSDMLSTVPMAEAPLTIETNLDLLNKGRAPHLHFLHPASRIPPPAPAVMLSLVR